jgi:hypothetical protein
MSETMSISSDTVRTIEDEPHKRHRWEAASTHIEHSIAPETLTAGRQTVDSALTTLQRM